MLLHDLLVMLHVRVRIYIPKEIKIAALRSSREEKEQLAVKNRRAVRKTGGLDSQGDGADVEKQHLNGTFPGTPPIPHLKPASNVSRSISPHTQYSSQSSSIKEGRIQHSQDSHSRHKPAVSFDRIVNVGSAPIGELTGSLSDSERSSGIVQDPAGPQVSLIDAPGEPWDGAELKHSGTEMDISELEEDEALDLTPSFLNDPEHASRGQRRWLEEICRQDDDRMVKGFRKFVISHVLCYTQRF
jgi:hypothetical protein